MSISELAEACTVAEATISRFCRRLGYKGYNAFKLAIANAAEPEKTEFTVKFSKREIKIPIPVARAAENVTRDKTLSSKFAFG